MAGLGGGGVKNPLTGTLDANGNAVTGAHLGTEWSDLGDQGAAPFMDDGSLDIHVSPSSGNDSNDGTQSSPVATIGEALSRVPKRIYRHPVRVYLDYGDYTGQDVRIFDHYCHPRSGTDAAFNIVGHDSSNPFHDSNNSAYDVQLGYALASGNRGTEELKMIGVNLTTWHQLYDTVFHYVDCVFTGSGGGQSNVVSAKWSNVDFTRPVLDGSDVFFNAIGGQIRVNEATVNTTLSARPFEAHAGAMCTFRQSDEIMTNASGNPRVRNGWVLGYGDSAVFNSLKDDQVPIWRNGVEHRGKERSRVVSTTDGTGQEFAREVTDSTDEGLGEEVRRIDVSGDNTAVSITNNYAGNLVHVYGANGDLSKRFYDVVASFGIGNATDRLSHQEYGGTITTSYSTPASELALSIDDTGETYSVIVASSGIVS